MGEAARRRESVPPQAEQPAGDNAAGASVPAGEGMSLAEMRAHRENLQKGLTQLRDQMLLQQGAILSMDELIAAREPDNGDG